MIFIFSVINLSMQKTGDFENYFIKSEIFLKKVFGGFC